jgi:hypothetical protein
MPSGFDRLRRTAGDRLRLDEVQRTVDCPAPCGDAAGSFVAADRGVPHPRGLDRVGHQLAQPARPGAGQTRSRFHERAGFRPASAADWQRLLKPDEAAEEKSATDR